ncbi:MAG: putative ABC exporter domain-containing protein, partial [Oscillospiraceae bacterium]
LIQQIWSSMLIGLFVLFQYSALHMSYNLSYLGLILIFLSYSLTVFLSQTLGMFLYTFVSDSEKKKTYAKTVLYILIAILLAYIGLHVLSDKGHIVKALSEAGNGLPVLLFPFAGWMGSFAGSILKGEYLQSALWLCLSGAAFAVMLVAMSRSKREYYEDVLASAETMQNTINSAKDGVPPEATPKVIKVGKSGIGKGWGASVFYHKHMLENRRASKIWIKPMSLMFMAMTIGFSIFMKGEGIVPIFSFAVYMQIFSVALGRFNREITKPFIYLVPESPFKKMLYALAETLPSELLESALIFIPVSIILGAPTPVCLLCILGRLSFSFLFISSSIAIERIWGGSLSKVAGILIYFVADMLISAPGVALAVILGMNDIVLFSPDVTTVLCITLMNIPVAALIIYSCKNVLQYAEL